MQTINYRPDPGFTGTDYFAYEILNSDGSTAIGVVFVEVVDGAPVSGGDFDIDFPLHLSVDVEPANVTFTGSVPAEAVDTRIRIVNRTDNTVLTSEGIWATNTATNHPLTPTVDTVDETWSYGPVDLPAGAEMRVEATHN